MELWRYEFYEILVRIANERYRKHGHCSSIYDALEYLINDHILPYSNPGQWQEFRDKTLWTLEVNDLFEANLENLKKVNNKITLKKAHDLMWAKLKTGLSNSEITYCFGMSRMTIMDEMRKTFTNHLLFVEFLEFIGRWAQFIKFEKGSEDDSDGKVMSYYQKLRKLLKRILLLHHLQFKDPPEEEVYGYESDFISNDDLSDL